MLTTATAVRRAVVRPANVKSGGSEVRYYPGADRLDYRPGCGVPVPVLLWVKQLLSEGVRAGFARWDGVRWGFEAV